MLIEMLLFYALLILGMALVAAAPFLAAGLLCCLGVLLLVRGYNAPLKAAFGLACVVAAGYLSLVTSNVDDRIPGTRPYHQARSAMEEQRRAQMAYAPGG